MYFSIYSFCTSATKINCIFVIHREFSYSAILPDLFLFH